MSIIIIGEVIKLNEALYRYSYIFVLWFLIDPQWEVWNDKGASNERLRGREKK